MDFGLLFFLGFLLFWSVCLGSLSLFVLVGLVCFGLLSLCCFAFFVLWELPTAPEPQQSQK